MRRASLAGRHLAAAIGAALLLAAAATAGAEVRITASFDNPSVWIGRQDARYLEIDVVAPEGVARRPLGRRPPLNIALVIDKSGSMAEARKLDYVREAAHALVDRLEYGDRFALVTYDDRVAVPLPSQAVEDRGRAHREIDRIVPGGATNLGGGLEEGFRQVERYRRPEAVNRVLLLSDGLANRGLTDPDRLSGMAWRAAEAGISLTTFGVGLEFNEDLLAGLAESGRGTYYYIDRPHRIPELLAGEFSTLRDLAAADVTIMIELHAEVRIEEVLGYEVRREGGVYRIPLGALAAGERRRIICRVAPPRWKAGAHRLGRVQVRWQPAGETRSLQAAQELEMRWIEDREAVRRSVNREVSERSSVYEANAARQRAAKLVDRGDLAGAKRVLDENRRQLEEAPVQSELVRQELRESEGYGRRISAPMAAEEKAAVQKDVKYKSYRTLQQK